MNLEALLIPLRFDTQGLKDSLSEAKSAIQSGDLAGLGSSLTSAGQSMMGVTTTIVGGFTSAIYATQNWAGTVDNLGDVLGTSADDSATLAYAIQRVGGNADALTGQMAYLVKGLTGADGGLGKTGEALQSLGISATDANGNLKPAKDLLLEVSNVVGNMPDGLEKTKIMTDLFGKSGKDLSDTLGSLANDGFAQANEKAKEMGLLMGDDAVNSSIEFGKSMEDLKASTQGLAVSFGMALLPAIQPIIDALGKLIQWFTALDPGIKTAIVSILGVVAALAPLLIIIGQVIGAVSTIAGVFGGVGGIVTAVTTAFSTLAAVVTGTIIPAIAALAPVILPVIAIIAAVAAAVALLYLGWKNNFLGIKDTLNLVINNIKAIFKAFTQVLQGDWKGAGETLKKAWQDTWDEVQRRFTAVKDWLTNTINDLKTSLTNVWDSLITQLKSAWSSGFDDIKNTVSNVWNSLKSSFSDLANNIKNFFTNVNWKQIGKDIIRGIGDGISSMMSWIRQKAQEIANNITDAIKDILGISSPSQVMKVEIGYNMAAGVIAGYEEQIAKFNPAMSMTVRSLATPTTQGSNAELISALSGISTKSTDFDYGKFGRAVRDAVIMATG
jgi:TP901 family phage tail tape measure protein